MLLNTAYFPPVTYMTCVVRGGRFFIEQWESYGKQSYRNRCSILSANGVQCLVVPVKHDRKVKLLTKDVRIDYSTPWQKLHYRSIESAYRNAPFYDYYIEEFLPFFRREEMFLLDLNNRILEAFLRIFNVSKTLTLTSDYEAHPAGVCDMRDAFHPKPSRRVGSFRVETKPYTQTFADRFPFIPDLSVMDLLFNMGPEAMDYFPDEKEGGCTVLRDL